MRFTAEILSFSESNLGYGPYFIVPNEIVNQFEGPKRNIRVKCFLNKILPISRAIALRGNTFYILINKEVLKQLKINYGDYVDVFLEPDESKYGVPISEEMEEVLFQDPEGADLFHLLTIGLQRSLIILISKYKNPQLRIERSFIILEHLRNNLGKIDMKQLVEDFKKFKF